MGKIPRELLRPRWGVGVLSALLLGGCAGAVPNDQLMLELQRERAQAAEQRLRVVELEARLVRIESEAEQRRERTRAAQAEQSAVLQAIARLVHVNQEALRHLQPEARILPSGVTDAPAAAADCEPGVSPEDQIRRLLARMRARPSAWRGGLSRQENEALRVLLRPERPLDRSNPLQDW